MTNLLTDQDKRLIYLFQGDLPVTPRPFAWLAGQLGWTEEEVLKRLREFKEAGLIRRFGATLYHQNSGFPANVMVAWQIPEERVEEAGQILAEVRLVSHCYQRRTTEKWPFNLYTMVHGEDEADCRRTVEEMAGMVESRGYELLFSLQELKKTSMRYFA